MILLFLLPFYDRGPERHPLRRPVATLTGIFVICAMAYLTYLGANAGPPTEQTIKPSAAVDRAGQAGARRSSISAARSSRSRAARPATRSAATATTGPGPELTHDRQRACRREAIARTLVNPTEPMPSYGVRRLPPKQFSAAVAFLSDLK